MSVQRRRGVKVTLYPRKRFTNNRGDVQWGPDRDSPITTTASVVPQRSSRAEVPGQVEVDVYRLTIRHDIFDLGLWTVLEWADREWDIVAPPAYHHGTRHTRHWSIDVRGRPRG